MSGFVGSIAGVFIGLTLIALFSNKLPISVAVLTTPLAVLFSIITWKVIKKEEER